MRAITGMSCVLCFLGNVVQPAKVYSRTLELLRKKSQCTYLHMYVCTYLPPSTHPHNR